ncbi:MAG: CoA transferase [Hyphomicrobiaceae bacterium]|nr:CoA transferase [Hyphomicrobiaceae bacterium]
MLPDFRPLAGVKVVDLSHVIAGPFATFHLAQLGADVLKIEAPDGDVMRRGSRGAQAFVALNAGKRKVRLDLAGPEARAKVMAEVQAADVFVDNLRPGSTERLGLGWEALHAVNRRLVYCSISGFGRDTERPAYDHVVQAATGMTLASGAEGDPPSKVGFPLIDAGAGIIAALAILAGLRERDRRGEGMLLDVSMAGAALQLMYPLTCEALTSGTRPLRQGSQAFSGSPAADVFETGDGGRIALAANTPRQLLDLLDVLGLAAMATDAALFDPPLSAGAPAAFLVSKDPAAVKARLATAIRGEVGPDLELRLTAARVPAAVVKSLDVFSREAVEAGTIAPLRLDDEGTVVLSPGLGFRVR